MHGFLAIGKNRALQVALLVLAVVALMGAGDDARFNDLGHRVMCVCGCRQILLECNHVGCTYSDRMRDELAAAINRGDSDDLTLQAFVQKYGTIVLAAPTTSGFNRVAWIAPYMALVLGLAAAVVLIRGWKRPAGQPTVAGSGPGDAALDPFRKQARRETEL